jgi:hypothetical protein
VEISGGSVIACMSLHSICEVGVTRIMYAVRKDVDVVIGL